MAPHYMEVTVRDQMALGAVTDRCVGAVSRLCIDDQESVLQSHCERCVWGCILVQASGR